MARRDPRFRLDFQVEASAELRELLDRSAGRAEVTALLRGLFPSYRVNAMARTTTEVLDLLGARRLRSSGSPSHFTGCLRLRGADDRGKRSTLTERAVL